MHLLIIDRRAHAAHMENIQNQTRALELRQYTGKIIGEAQLHIENGGSPARRTPWDKKDLPWLNRIKASEFIQRRPTLPKRLPAAKQVH